MAGNFDDIIRQILGMAKPTPDDGRVQLAGDVVPLQLNDPANFTQPDRMPDSRVQPWTDQDWANNLFIKPANDPGRRQRPNTRS